MESVQSDARRAVITRVTEGHWRAVADGREIGRGDASRRPDGRIFLSVDAWHGAVFDRLAEAMLAELPRPLHTMVDGFDQDTTARWERAGMAVRRRRVALSGAHRLPAGCRGAPGRGDAAARRRGRGRRAAGGVLRDPGRDRRHRWLGDDAGRGAGPTGRGPDGSVAVRGGGRARPVRGTGPRGDTTPARPDRADRVSGPTGAVAGSAARCWSICSRPLTAAGSTPRPRTSTSPVRRPWRCSRASVAGAWAAGWS